MGETVYRRGDVLGESMAAAAHDSFFCATHTLYTNERSCITERMRRMMGDPHRTLATLLLFGFTSPLSCMLIHHYDHRRHQFDGGSGPRRRTHLLAMCISVLSCAAEGMLSQQLPANEGRVILSYMCSC